LVVRVEPMTANLPLRAIVSRTRPAMNCSASLQLAGSSLPLRRISGSCSLSSLWTKSKPKRPFTQRNSPLMPERSRLLARMISPLRTLSVVLQPLEQCVQIAGT